MTSTTTDPQIREIVLASDFSPHSDRALRAAHALAHHFGARLRLLHVVHHAREERAACARLAELAAERAADVGTTTAVVVGAPASEIVKYAAAQRADLIVMGTHGRTGLAHALRGSVAETVVRHARCQVLTIGARAAVPEPVSAGPGQRAAPEAEASGCLVCGRASDGLVCDPCKGLIRAEAAYRLMQDEKAERR